MYLKINFYFIFQLWSRYMVSYFRGVYALHFALHNKIKITLITSIYLHISRTVKKWWKGRQASFSKIFNSFYRMWFWISVVVPAFFCLFGILIFIYEATGAWKRNFLTKFHSDLHPKIIVVLKECSSRHFYLLEELYFKNSVPFVRQS